MLEYVRGRVEERGPDWVVLDLRGLGLRVQAPLSTIEALPPAGSEARLWTYLHVREDVRAIYGFATQEERRLFVQLLGVSGVGPRMALAALSMLSPDRLSAAIDSGDETTLSRIPGVGKKTASRMVLDLKGKVRAAGGDGAVAAASDDAALEALLGLGFSRPEVSSVLAALPPDSARSPEETIRLALQAISARGART